MNANCENLDFYNKFLKLIQCPISSEAIKDPVMLLPTCEIYDRKSIELWLEKDKICPKTHEKLTYLQLIPVKKLSDIIKLFLDILPDYIRMNLFKQENLLKRIEELQSINIVKEERINVIYEDFLKMADNESKYIYHKRKIESL